MSDPTQHHDEPDDLDLDAETVADLEPDEAGDVQGGSIVCLTPACPPQSNGVMVCATVACKLHP